MRAAVLCTWLVLGASLVVAPPAIPQTGTPTAATPSSSELEGVRVELREIRRQVATKRKDAWDRLAAIAPLLGGVLVASIGGLATYVFNKRQREAEDARAQRTVDAENERKTHELAILRVQTLQAFLPELRSSDERNKEAAVLAITSLGDTELMSRVAALFQGEGVVSALTKVATSGGDASVVAERSLGRVTERLETAVVRLEVDGHSIASGFVAAPGVVVSVDHAVPPQGKQVAVAFSDGRIEDAEDVSRIPDVQLIKLAVSTGGIAPLQLVGETFELDGGAPLRVLGYSGRRGQTTREMVLGSFTGWAELPEIYPGRLLTASMQIEPGFSGAPVVNAAGEIVGISYAYHRDLGRAYLIPSSAVRELLASRPAESDASALGSAETELG